MPAPFLLQSSIVAGRRLPGELPGRQLPHRRRPALRGRRGDGILRTRNVLMRMDGALRVTPRRMRPHTPARRSRVQGWKIAGSRGGPITRVTRRTSDLHPQPTAGLLRLDAACASAIPALSGHGDGAAQEDWLPVPDPASGNCGHLRLRATRGGRHRRDSGRCAPVFERSQREALPLPRLGRAGAPASAHTAAGSSSSAGRVPWAALLRASFLHADEGWQLRRLAAFHSGAWHRVRLRRRLSPRRHELLITYGVEDAEHGSAGYRSPTSCLAAAATGRPAGPARF